MKRPRNALRVLLGRVDLDREIARARYFRDECLRAREDAKEAKRQLFDYRAAMMDPTLVYESTKISARILADMARDPKKFLPTDESTTPTDKSTTPKD